MILDEGDRIKNPQAGITITLKTIGTPHRIVLTGAPIQNNLIELWSMFDFVVPGKLGTQSTFEREFAIPINRAAYSNANAIQVRIGYACSVGLRSLVGPFLLRRLKQDVLKDILPDKSEQVLFCKLSESQSFLYRQFVEGAEVRAVIEGKRNALFAIDALRKICNHPQLFTQL